MKIKANGIEINYEKEGSGPVVAMSHSLGCNLHMWDEQAKALASRYTVLRFDTRGHGRTSAPEGAYSLEQMADDLKGLLDGLGIKETHFVGLSMGGMIGQTFALKHPAMVKSLVLCDTTSRYPAAAAPIWEDRIKTVSAKGMEPLVAGTLERWFTAPFRAARQDVVDTVRAMIRGTSPVGYAGCCHAIAALDLTDRLAALTLPTLVLVGKDDPGTPVAASQAIHARIAGSRLVVLEAAAHLSNLEQPEAFTRALTGFLAGVA